MKGLELEKMSEIIQPEGENLPEVKSTTTVSTSGKDSTTDWQEVL